MCRSAQRRTASSGSVNVRPAAVSEYSTVTRFPVIDPERGLVFAVTLLHYLKTLAPSQMYVSEVFKVVEGRIVRIDNSA